MTLMRTADEPVVSGEEVWVAATNGERRIIVRIAVAAVGCLAGREVQEDESQLEFVEQHWIRIAAIAAQKIYPGFSQVRVTLDDISKPASID